MKNAERASGFVGKRFCGIIKEKRFSEQLRKMEETA